MILPRLTTMARLKKVVAIVLLPTFILSNIAFAETSKVATTNTPSKPVETVTNPDKIVIPRDYGLVKSRYTAKDSNRLIVHIQDAHCNYEAQSNIIKILECLVKNDGLSLVSVEGADGFIDTSWFKAFPDKDIRKEVADYFMKKGEITGPEFLSITTNSNIRLFGAETRSYYIENLNAFTSSYPLKEDTEKYFNQIKAVLNKLKAYIYSEELKELDLKSQDYESKKLSFTDYVKYLETLGSRYKVAVRPYENLFKLISVLVYEKKIDFNVVDKERAAVIDTITKKLDKESLTELVNKSLEFKSGKISSAEYYDYLRALAVKYGISLSSEYPNLFNYIIYNPVYSRIENEHLFDDIKKFEEALKEKIFANNDQRELERLSRHINTLLGLANIKLLNGDFDYYKEHRDEFSHEAFASFINKMSGRYGFAYEVDQPSEAVKESMPKLEDFYSIAIKRDKALVDNTLNAMNKEDARISVLVTGGFHSEGITKLLEKQGVSYIVICPNITKEVETPYIKILTNQRTPLEEILSDTGATADTKSVKGNMLAPFSIAWAIGLDEKQLNRVSQAVLRSDLHGTTIAMKDRWLGLNLKNWIYRALQYAKKYNIPADKEIVRNAYIAAMRQTAGTLKNFVHDKTERIIADPNFKSVFDEVFDTFQNPAQDKPAQGEVKAPDTSVREKSVKATLGDDSIDPIIRDYKTKKTTIWDDGKSTTGNAGYIQIITLLKSIVNDLDDEVFRSILEDGLINAGSDERLINAFTKENLLKNLEPSSDFKVILVQPKDQIPGIRIPGILMTRPGSNFGHYSLNNKCIYTGQTEIDELLADGSSESLREAATLLMHELAEYTVRSIAAPGTKAEHGEDAGDISLKVHRIAELLERRIVGPSKIHKDDNILSALDDTLEIRTMTYFDSITPHLLEEAKKMFNLKDVDVMYLGQIWSQYLKRNKPSPKIITDLSIIQHPKYDPDGIDPNFILMSMLLELAPAERARLGLTEEAMEKLIAKEYPKLKTETNRLKAANDIVLTINSLDGGIGENFGRLKWLQERAKAAGKSPKEIKNIRMTAKGTDIGFDVEYKGKKEFVSIAELKLMQVIELARQCKFLHIRFQPLVNWQSKEAYDTLLNTYCLDDRVDDRVDDGKKSKKTYGRVMQELGINILDMIEQADLPAVKKNMGNISLSPHATRQPGGHGQFGFLFLYDSFFNSALDTQKEDGKTHIRVFYNGDNPNSHADPYVAGEMARKHWPIVKLTTLAMPIDKKGGKDGVRVIKEGNEITFVPAQMEEGDAKSAKQLPVFHKAGLPGGLGKSGQQPFNTNIFYINTTVLHDILKELLELRDGNGKEIITKEEFCRIISPTLIDKAGKVSTDGREYIPLDGAIGTAMLNLNEFFLTSKDPRVKDILSPYGIDRIVYCVNVPRTEFFTPNKTCSDGWMQFYSDYYTRLDTTDWMLHDREGKTEPPEFDVIDDEMYWNELQNLVDSFGNASVRGPEGSNLVLKSLRIRGAVKLKDAQLTGDVVIINKSDKNVDLTKANELASYLQGSRLALNDILIIVEKDGTITYRSLAELYEHDENTVKGILVDLGVPQGVIDFMLISMAAAKLSAERNGTGAIRGKGGELTLTEHGTRTYGISASQVLLANEMKGEATVNGAIAKLVMAKKAFTFLPDYQRLISSDKILPVWECGLNSLNDTQEDNVAQLYKIIGKSGLNFVIIKGLRKEIEARVPSAADLIFHPGVTRKYVYMDENDFLHLLLFSNGVELIREALEHEKADIDNPGLSEEAIEKIAPTNNVRLALKMKDLNVKALLRTAKTEVEKYLTAQHDSREITDEIYESAKATYKNLEAWVTDEHINRVSPMTRLAILDAIKQAIQDGNWFDIVDVFRQDVTFGTAGIREKAALTEEALKKLAQYGPGAGILKGPNTINDIVLLIKTAGVIQYAKKNGLHKVAIGYDSRIAGKQFAELIAQSFLAHSTKGHEFTIYMFDEASPFPELSFAVTTKNVRADLGILISASHNPSNYNGYKITNYTGMQLAGNMRDAIVDAIKGVTTKDIQLKPIEEAKDGQLIWLGGKERIVGKDYKDGKYHRQLIDMHTLHVEQVKKFIIDRDVVRQYAPRVKVGYAAFNGAGYRAVPRLLQELGFTDTKVISSLQEMNGMFPAFGWGEQPDPGDPISADIAVREFVKEHGQRAFDDLDILIGTDPDADRAGLIVKVPEPQQKFFGKYKLLSANDAWTLLLWYRMQRETELNGGKLPDAGNKYITFSHVTTDALERVGKLFGVDSLGEMKNKEGEEAGDYLNGKRSWVGFSLIAEFCQEARAAGKTNLGGAEESNGFSILGGPIAQGEILANDGHVNDKDGAFAALLLAEVTAYAKSKGTTLFGLLDNIYLNPGVGYFATANKPMPRVGAFKGAEGITKKMNLLKQAQAWMKEANGKVGTGSPFMLAGLPVIGAIEFKTAKYDEQHYAGFPDEGIRFFFADPDLKPGDPFTKSRNYITIRPAGTSQTLRFYVQLFADDIDGQNIGNVKYRDMRRAEALALQTQVELLEAADYRSDISNVTDQMLKAGYEPANIKKLISMQIDAAAQREIAKKAPGVTVELPVALSDELVARMTNIISTMATQTGRWATEQFVDGGKTMLGWMNLGAWRNGPMASMMQDMADFARQVQEEKARKDSKDPEEIAKGVTTDIVFIGQGGSVECIKTLSAIFGVSKKAPNIHIIDTTDEEYIGQLKETLPYKTTRFVVLSKSMTTGEVHSGYKLFFDDAMKRTGLSEKEVAEKFTLITDSGKASVSKVSGKTVLTVSEKVREPFRTEVLKRGFSNVFYIEPNTGGRYSWDTAVGILPAMIMSEDIGNVNKVLNGAQGMEETAKNPYFADNAAAQYGAFKYAMQLEGRNRPTLVLPDEIAGYGPWYGQLDTESLGKTNERSSVVIDHEAFAVNPEVYTQKRFFVRVKLGASDTRLDGAVRKLKSYDLPVFTITLPNSSPGKVNYEDFGAFLKLSEFATAIAGYLMDINPVNQPGVESYKRAQELYLKNGVPAFNPAYTTTSGAITLNYEAAIGEESEGRISKARLEEALKSLGSSTAAAKYAALTYLAVTEHGRDYATMMIFKKLALQPSLTESLNSWRKSVRLAFTQTNFRVDTLGEEAPCILHAKQQGFSQGENSGFFTIVRFSQYGNNNIVVPGSEENYGAKRTFSEFTKAQAAGTLAALSEAKRLGVMVEIDNSKPENIDKNVQAFADFVEEANKHLDKLVELSQENTPKPIATMTAPPESTAKAIVEPTNTELTGTSSIDTYASLPVSEKVERIIAKVLQQKGTAISPAIVQRMKVELTALENTIGSIGLPNIERKPIIIAHDTGLDPESDTTDVAQAAEAYLEEHYGGKFIVARGKGEKLIEQIRIARSRLNDENAAVVTIAGDETLDAIKAAAAKSSNTSVKDLAGTILNVQINPSEPYVPFVMLYSLAFRIVYDQVDDDTVSLLNAFMDYVTAGDNVQPFTSADLKQGIIRILPRTGRINPTEAREAYLAQAAALRSL